MANEVRLIDANAFKKHILIGAEFADENTLLTVLNTLDCEITIDPHCLPDSIRPTGRWLDNEDYMFCSQCGMQWNYCDNDTQDFKFCPNCGAKMEG